MLEQNTNMTMKHSDIVAQLAKLETGLNEAKKYQESIILLSKQLSPVETYARIATQVRGRRRYLNWRQRYYKRPFFMLSDEHGTYMLGEFKSVKEEILNLEQQRIVANFKYQTAVYEYDQLLQLKAQLKVWRKLRTEL